MRLRVPTLELCPVDVAVVLQQTVQVAVKLVLVAGVGAVGASRGAAVGRRRRQAGVERGGVSAVAFAAVL